MPASSQRAFLKMQPSASGVPAGFTPLPPLSELRLTAVETAATAGDVEASSAQTTELVTKSQKKTREGGSERGEDNLLRASCQHQGSHL